MAYDIILGRTKDDKDKFGDKGTILLAKQYVTMGRSTSLANKIYMDVAKAHVVFVCGKRGSGKCLLGDTLITLSDGRQIRIKDLEHKEGDIISMDGGLKLTKAKKTNFFSRTTSSLIKVKLRSGKKMHLTPEHPLFTVNGWSPAEQLNIGQKIATARQINAFGKKSIAEHKIKVIAYLLAEDNLAKNQIIFSSTDPEIVDEFKNSLKSLYDSLQTKDFKKQNYLIFKNDVLKHLELCETRSENKLIPDCIFTLPKYQLALFLNRLFSYGADIEHFDDNWYISYSSKSEQLITQIHHLLLRYGILSIIKEKNDVYEIKICGENVTGFCKEIGFFGKKESKQKVALSDCIDISRNLNQENISKEVKNDLHPQNWVSIGQSIGHCPHKVLGDGVQYSSSSQKLMTLTKFGKNLTLQDITTSDIYWDEIVSLEEEIGEFKVYDITVPEHHNFLANDIIVHNSYSMGAIAESAAKLPKEISQNLSFILLDTMGIYWTMKYSNVKDKKLLDEWGLKGDGLDVEIFTPSGYFDSYKKDGIPTDHPFSIKPSELQPQDWFLTFGLGPNDSISVFIESVVNDLKADGIDYDIDQIIEHIKKRQDADKDTINAALNRFENAKKWGVFDKEGTPLEKLAIPGKISVLDVSCYATSPNGWAVKSLVIGLVSQKLFNERMMARKQEEYETIKQMTSFGYSKKGDEALEKPLVWLVIDEAHEFLPKEGKTSATDSLITILREGRQPGISLILATQQPGKIHTDVMTQSDIILAHRITARFDIDALKMLSSSYMTKGIDEHLNILPRVAGAALIIDDKNERIFSTRIRPRSTWHGGEAPMAIREEKKLF